jgi:hypothetical protein
MEIVTTCAYCIFCNKSYQPHANLHYAQETGRSTESSTSHSCKVEKPVSMKCPVRFQTIFCLCLTLSTRTEIMQNLRTEDMHTRLSDIPLPYESTFEWIWTANDMDFVSWLQSGTEIYWISGKPGSGKSTLMKYLYRSPQTQRHLKSGDYATNLICPSFFFHNRGSKNQKSIEGLLRSLLHQIFSFEKMLLDAFLDTYRTLRLNNRDLCSRQGLEDALALIMNQTKIRISICLFLDALDEYDGDPDSVANFLRSMVRTRHHSATRIKVCFSSRLYNAFIDEFGECPGFKIHERTQTDIQRVIDGRMSESQSITDTLALGDAQTQEQFEELKTQLTSRAEGVFLWLKFALDNLLRAHREGGTMADILRHLSILPDELERFYQLIIEDVLSEHRRETYVMLETVLRYEGELSVEILFGVLLCSSISALKDTRQELAYPGFAQSIESQFVRRIRSRCGGLLEVTTRKDNVKVVLFMHQTVREFVSQPGFRQFVVPEERDLPIENGHSFLSKYGLCRLYHTKYNGMEIHLHTPFLNHATEVELTTGRSQKQLIDEVPPLRFATHAAEPLRLSVVNFNSASSFAVSRNLRLYISETIKTSREFVNQNPGPSLLHFAIKYETRWLAYHPESPDTLDMVHMLLMAGACTKTVWEENKNTALTPFQAMFYLLHNFPLDTTPSYMLDDLTKVTKYFLEIGDQDPNISLRIAMIWPSINARSLTALHVSSGALTALLLEYGAKVNAEDEFGRRPLDLVILMSNVFFEGGSGSSHKTHGRRERLVGEAYETVIQLLAAGGKFTRTTVGEDAIKSPDSEGQLCALEYFIEVIEDAGYDGSPIRNEFLRLKEEAIRNPPRQPLAGLDSARRESSSRGRTPDPERSLKRPRPD